MDEISPEESAPSSSTATSSDIKQNMAEKDTNVIENDTPENVTTEPSSLHVSRVQSRRASVFRASSRRLSSVAQAEAATHIPPCPKRLCKPCLRENHPLPPKPTKLDHFKHLFLCPPQGPTHKFILALMMTLMIWGILWGLVEEEALPHGVIFYLILIEVFGFLGGMMFSVIRLPPLLGMLATGIFFGNFPLNIFKVRDKKSLNFWFGAIRGVALAVILTRAGLGLNPSALRRLKFVVFRLAFIPCLVECTSTAIVSHFLLDFPWLWSWMLGFAIAAVSPAVVVPGMLYVQKKIYLWLKACQPC